MTGTLALVGDRPFTDGCTHDRLLLQTSGAKEVAVLPTGAAFEDPAGLVARAREWFEPLGAKVTEVPVLRRTDADDEELVAQVREASFLYLVGDSPMHVRSVMKSTPMWAAIEQSWRDGSVLAAAGGSAMAVCDPMVDPRGGAFTLGLGLIEQLAVVAQSSWSADQARRTIKLAPRGVPVIGIDARAALIRHADGSWTAAGSGDAVVYVDGVEADLTVLGR